MHLTLSLTHRCCFACSYCYAGTSRPTAMSRETAELAVDGALEAAEGKLDLGFFGGEPLLAWDLLRQTTEYAVRQAERRAVRLRTTVTTNASCLTSERMAWLQSAAFHVGVSLDGNRAMHDECRRYADGRSSFDDCLRGARIALAAEPSTEVIAVASPRNVCHLAAGVHFLATTVGFQHITVSPDYYATWSEEHLATWRAAMKQTADIYLQHYRGGTPFHLSYLDNKIISRLKGSLGQADICHFGAGEYAVAPSGRVYPCERLIGDDSGEGWVLGDVHDGWVPSAPNDSPSAHRCTNPECASCTIEPVCQRHCGCVNYALTGHADRTDGVVCFHERTTAALADRVADTLFAEGNQAFLRRFYGEEGPAETCEEDE